MPSSLQRQRIIKRLKQLAVPKAAPSLLANDTTNDGEPEIPKPELGQIRLFPTMVSIQSWPSSGSDKANIL